MSKYPIITTFGSVVEYMRSHPNHTIIIVGFGQWFVYLDLGENTSSLKFDHVAFCREYFKEVIGLVVTSGFPEDKVPEHCHMVDIFHRGWHHPDMALERERRLMVRAPWGYRTDSGFDPANDAWLGGSAQDAPPDFYKIGCPRPYSL